MQQTTYAQVRSRDPRNTFYGVNPGAASASPYMARPTQTADISMYQRPAVPAGLSSLVGQTSVDYQNMLNPVQSNGLPSDIPNDVQPQAQQAVTLPEFENQETMQAAGLSPSSIPPESEPLPVTPPTKPLEAGPMEFTPSQVEQAQGVINTLAQGQDAGDGMTAATRAKDQERVNNDILQVAKAKDPSEAWNKLQKEPFYQNSSFYTGLMGVGLSIMSGKSPIEAFQIGQGMANQDETKKQLEANRDALIEQGFSQDSIAAAIANGDPSLLKMRAVDPAQKEALYTAREERQNAEWDRRQQIQEQTMRERADETRRAAEERANMNFERQKELIGYRDKVKAERAEQAAQSFNFNPKEVRLAQNTAEGTVAKQWAEKGGLFNQSNKDLDLADKAVKDKDYQTARSAYMQAIMNSARAEIGATRSLTEEDLGHFAEDPSIFVRVGNKFALKSGWRPTDSALAYARKQANVGHTSAMKGVADAKRATIEAYIGSGMDKKRATALVNRAIPSGGFYDPLGVFSEQAEEAVGGAATNPKLNGALSAVEDTSWFTQ
ncbi:hypothetical protein PQC55_gp025 [Escherichia phage vB_EcoP-CHD5UKE1]|uniref:Uncharacterized protein n=1 Tax=Escherichia phage vB_EcoP-CHD5UKE1 TaxID=2865805 RepID=A0ABX9AFK1_9CAUD|nr:hypothetical protein PQC55_gp025 [Escherichia phage vB_EcoP-CHD5UKE1]QZI80521.1 hypothetical protein CHD5UKE1_0025 [Escherichia phage vB_EcoP-CHD5UKE1]